MKILFCSATLLHGGAERVISILSNELVNMGHDVNILLYYDRPIWYELDDRVKVQNDEKVIGKSGVLKHIVYRHKYFKSTDADIIISFLAPINMINILAKIFTGKKLIVADRNDPRKIPVNCIIRRLRNFLYYFANGVVLQSINNKNYFSKYVQNKSTVIFNPVDVGVYKGIALRSEKKDEIIAIGRLIEQKNPFMLLEAFEKITKKFPTYTLIYYGEGNLAEEIRKKAEKLGISEKVYLPGAVKNIFEKIKNAKLYVMTSKYEGMPNALIEAMCVGIPVISTKVSGAVDLISNRENGRLIECFNVNELAETMLNLLEDYDTAVRYAEKAIELNEKLNAKQIIENWLNYIDEVCAR